MAISFTPHFLSQSCGHDVDFVVIQGSGTILILKPTRILSCAVVLSSKVIHIDGQIATYKGASKSEAVSFLHPEKAIGFGTWKFNKMASLQALFPTNSTKQLASTVSPSLSQSTFLSSQVSFWSKNGGKNKNRPLTVVAAVGDVSPDGTTYLFIGAALVALLGTGFPVLFSRKDL